MTRNLLDWSSDNGKQLFHQIKLQHDVPEYVTQVIRDEERHDKLASAKASPNHFAVPHPEPRFPCHSKAAAWLSAAYFAKQVDDMSDTQRKVGETFLVKQAAFWGIASDVAKLLSNEIDQMKKAASYDTIVPVRNSEEVRAAAEWLKDNAAALGAEHGLSYVVKVAECVLDAVDRMNVSGVHKDRLTKLAAKGGCHNAKKVASIIANMDILPEYRDTRRAIISTVNGMSSGELHTEHVKIAEAMAIMAKNPCQDFLTILAPDKPARAIKLAGDQVVLDAQLEKLSEEDWLKIDYSGPRSLNFRPMSLDDLNEQQARQLVRIAR
jgi:hypothetical protein